MSVKAVIGLGFGDEGKGCITNYLCSRNSESLVVRFNGGHQAGHTVAHNGVRHVFSNFGSGTLQGSPTYWSEFCTIDPEGIYNEYLTLKTKGYTPILFINGKCPVTTPFDKFANQVDCHNKNHGTVGVGFGKTIKREEDCYSLLYEDLFYPSILEEKLRLIKLYYKNNFQIEESVYLYLDEFYSAVNFIIKNFQKVYSLPKVDNYILEGSQGLLLDQHYGFFPHVTRSNTGTKNIKKLFPFDLVADQIEFYLVTRAYQTRHGNGFMTNEGTSHQILQNSQETNVSHRYQGEFRRSILDLDLLKYVIEKDDFLRTSKKKKLAVTCLNAMKNNYKYSYKGETYECMTETSFINKIKEIIFN